MVKAARLVIHLCTKQNDGFGKQFCLTKTKTNSCLCWKMFKAKLEELVYHLVSLRFCLIFEKLRCTKRAGFYDFPRWPSPAQHLTLLCNLTTRETFVLLPPPLHPHYFKQSRICTDIITRSWLYTLSWIFPSACWTSLFPLHSLCVLKLPVTMVKKKINWNSLCLWST